MALANTNISTQLVANEIAVASNDIGTLCSSTNINKYSKYKPVIYTSDFPDRSGNWWRANNGNCGINIASYTTMSAMFTALRASSTVWAYVPPTGGSNAPYRLPDFRSYNHTAMAPISTNTLAAIYYKNNSTISASATINVPDTTELSLSDIGNAVNLANCYFAVGISKVGSTTYQYITEGSTVTNGGGGGVEIPISSLSVGNYHVVFFLSTVSHTTITSVDDGTYVPIPENAIQTVEIKETDFLVAIGGNTYWDANKTYFELVLVNESSGVRQLNGCTIRIKYADNKTGPDTSGETSFEVHTNGQADGVIIVQAGQTVTISSSYPVSGVDNPVLNSLPLFDAPDNRGGWIFFSNTSNSFYNTDTEIGSLA